MDLAKKISQLSQHPRYKFGCVIYKSARVISIGVNKDNAAPKRWVKQHRPNMNLHAEIDALLGLTKEQTKNAIMYVYGSAKLTSPCESCQTAINQMGIKKVVFVDNNKYRELSA